MLPAPQVSKSFIYPLSQSKCVSSHRPSLHLESRGYFLASSVVWGLMSILHPSKPWVKLQRFVRRKTTRSGGAGLPPTVVWLPADQRNRRGFCTVMPEWRAFLAGHWTSRLPHPYLFYPYWRHLIQSLNPPVGYHNIWAQHFIFLPQFLIFFLKSFLPTSLLLSGQTLTCDFPSGWINHILVFSLYIFPLENPNLSPISVIIHGLSINLISRLDLWVPELSNNLPEVSTWATHSYLKLNIFKIELY